MSAAAITLTPTVEVFALLTRAGRKGKWKLHGVYPTHDAAWEASATLPKSRASVWITRATAEQIEAARHSDVR